MSLPNLIKQNFVVAIGLALPVLIVIIFLVSAWLPRALTPAPEYTVLFTVTQYDHRPGKNDTDYIVDNGILTAVITARKENETDKKKLFSYSPQKNAVSEIKLDLPEEVSGKIKIPVKAFDNKKIMTESLSPDGYAFTTGRQTSGHGFFFLFDGGYRDGYRLSKGAASYKIPEIQGVYYGNNAELLGWVKE